MKKTVLKEFNELRSKIARIPNIGHGGCGIVAYVFYKWLVKRKIKSKIYYGYGLFSFGEDDNQKYIKSKGKEGSVNGCGHALIKIGRKFYDCREEGNKVSDVYENVIDYHEAPINFVLKSIVNPDNWNDDFNRKKYIPLIEEYSGIKIPNI